MMSEPIRTIRRYVDRNYGDAITVEDPPYYDVDKKFWVAELQSDYPRRIHDDRKNESFVKFLKLTELGEVRLSDDNWVTATSRDELVKRLKSRLRQWQESAQQIVLLTSSEELANLSALKDAIKPIDVVVRNLGSKGRHFLTQEELKRANIAPRWVEFLVQTGLLESSPKGVTYTNLFTSMEQETADQGLDEFVTHVMAYVMKNHYSTIRQVFKVWRFETYLHAATCYYGPSIQAGRMLYRKEDSLIRLYHKWYSKSYSDLRLPGIFQELAKQKILRKVDDYWYGSEAIWSGVKPLIPTMPQVITGRRG